jgi:hypothetical protein
VAESGTLLRCYTRKGIEGSNPSLSAYEFFYQKKFNFYFIHSNPTSNFGNWSSV